MDRQKSIAILHILSLFRELCQIKNICHSVLESSDVLTPTSRPEMYLILRWCQNNELADLRTDGPDSPHVAKHTNAHLRDALPLPCLSLLGWFCYIKGYCLPSLPAISFWSPWPRRKCETPLGQRCLLKDRVRIGSHGPLDGLAKNHKLQPISTNPLRI